MKNCFAFNRDNASVILTDDRGCPAKGEAIGPFTYDEAKGVAEATIRSMFKFPESSEVHFQVNTKFNNKVFYYI